MTIAPESPAPAIPAAADAPPKESNTETATSPLMHIGRRLAALVVLLVFAHAWLGFHLNVDIAKLLMIELFGSLCGALATLLTKGELAELRRSARKALWFALRTPVLVTAYSIFILAGTVIGSVRIVAASEEGKGQFTIVNAAGQEVGEGNLVNKEDRDHFTYFAHRFGRHLTLKMAGRAPHPFSVYPWWSRTIRVATLTALPSILLRIPPEVEHALPGPELQLLSDGVVIARYVPAVGETSILLGSDKAIPASFQEAWKLQIKAAGFGAEEAPILNSWMNPRFIQPLPNQEIKPEMKLSAQLMHEGQPIAATPPFPVIGGWTDRLLVPEVIAMENQQ